MFRTYKKRKSFVPKCTRLTACFLLTGFLSQVTFLSHMAYADLQGTCVSGPLFCINPGASCTITVDGVTKNGKCRTVHGGAYFDHLCVCKPNDGTKLDESRAKMTKSIGIGPIPEAPATVTFDIEPEPEGSVALVPERFGGGGIGVSVFAGQVTMRSIPTADPNIDQIEVVSGEIVAPSVILHNGQPTGVNTFKFVGPGSSIGTLNRTTGEFYFPARGKVVNDLFPPQYPIETLGDYFGTVDMATGVAIVDTRTFDFIPEPVIPTVSQWGLIVMAGVLLTAGAIVILRRRRVATT